MIQPWAQILIIIACIFYLLFFSNSFKRSKLNEKIEEDEYVKKETMDLYDNIYAFFGRLGAIFMILWSAYELYKYFS